MGAVSLALQNAAATMIALDVLLAAWLTFLAVALGIAMARVWRGERQRSTSGEAPRRVLLIRPCAGDERGLSERLARSRPSRSELQIVFAVQNEDDAAWPIALGAAEALTSNGVRAMAHATHARGLNHKVVQLERVLLEFGNDADVVMWADSDVDLASLDLDALIEPLADRAVAAAWAAPVECGPVRSLGDAATHAVLGASWHSFPLLAELDRTGVVGKVFAVRSSALREIGGLSSLHDVLGEDIALASALRGHGFQIRRVTQLAHATGTGRTFSWAVKRFARWMNVIRGQRPLLLVSYPLMFFPTPLIAVLSLFAPHGPAMLLITIALRWAVALLASHTSGRGWHPVSDLGRAALADLTLLSAFLLTLTGREVVWRNKRLRVRRGGRLELVH